MRKKQKFYKAEAIKAIEENKKLKQQLKNVEMEREFLKKAAAYFAKKVSEVRLYENYIAIICNFMPLFIFGKKRKHKNLSI